MSGRPQRSEKKSAFESFKETPAYPVLLNLTLFAAGVVFIQSSAMDMLSPQL
ncbi:hypothetical protein PACTADRAFT_2163 [Pachysolen tannophilus NRRL Y-2460]|uniref:Uncharacterized protein n=1 Tax=Pachysolen tannophilus NRRL Y-2460 TaxID=669874 RepID=A0A1E4TVU5_PACTA|nr:hypothetical protein PACTADRAFT_2163 [Pachysolen tannophilus NRRL Y-2460]